MNEKGPSSRGRRPLCPSGLPGRLRLLGLACCLLAFLSSPVSGQHRETPKQQRVLILYSFNDQYSYTGNVRKGLGEGLHALPERERPYVYEEQLDLGRLGRTKSATDALAAYLGDKYRSRPVDMVITESLPASEFLLGRPDLFPGAPRLFLNLIGKGDLPGVSHDASFSALSDGGKIAITTILEMLPRVRRIVVVGDKSQCSSGIFGDLRESARAFAGRAELEFWDNLSFDELYERARKLPGNAGILYLGMSYDRRGTHAVSGKVAKQLGESASVPVFGVLDSHIGGSVVGGFVRSGEKEGHLICRIAAAGYREPLRLSKDQLKEALTGYYFDDRELKRWGIPDKRLPSGSVVLNREKSLWERYRYYILAAIAAFTLETLLVITLVRMSFQRRAALRQLAEVNSSLTQRTIELAEATGRAEKANQAKSTFLANMSHELRSPMNAILGFSDIMQNDRTLSPGQRENLGIIRRSGEYLLSLIDDVLDMAKIEAGRIRLDEEPVDLHAMVSDIITMMRDRAAKKGLDLLLDQSGDFPRLIRGDGVKLKQVVINLLTNAVKFTERGSVSLRLRFLPDEKSPMISLEVEDSGIGISRDDQAEIFNAFVQVGKANSQKGTGLGLAITKQFIDLMGGSIRVESVPGEGSLFRVELPAKLIGEAGPEPSPAKDRARPIALAQGGEKWRILIVEDQLENRLLLERLLKGVGFQVRLAENGAEGVQIFQAWRPHFIWMDRRMPVMDGVDATRAIRRLEGGKDVRIAAVTASGLAEHREELIAAGMDDFVRKPFRPEEIFDCLERRLGVRYVYEQPEISEAREGDAFNLSAVNKLSLALRGDLTDALVRGDTERISRIVCSIGDEDAALSKALAHFVQGFDYMPILKVLEECSGTVKA
jgi:signal transduction histidine kinase/CheY-like chemotaxis protein